MTFRVIPTEAGAAKIAVAIAAKEQLAITHMAFGDGGGSEISPDPKQTALVNEVYRAPLNELKQDPETEQQFIAEGIIPPEEGGWFVREVGLYDAAGDLVYVANFPSTYKPATNENSRRDMLVRLHGAVSSVSAIELIVDPSVVVASRAWVSSTFTPSSIGKLRQREFFAKHVTGFRVVSHRGREYGPENTVAGLSSLVPGTYAVETDYRKTSDGRFLILHDETVDRTTDGTGALSDFTFDAARALDAGSWYHSEYTGEKLPTIGEYVLACAERGIRYIFLQPYGMESVADAQQAIDEVEAVGGLSNVVFMANNLTQLNYIRSVSEDVLVGLFGTTLSNLETNLAEAIRHNVCLMLSAPGDASYQANKAIYSTIKAEGIVPGVSTLNDPALMEDAALNSDACFALTDFASIYSKWSR